MEVYMMFTKHKFYKWITFVTLIALCFAMLPAQEVQADWSTFNHPDYYYAPLTNAPTGTYYRSAGFNPDGTKIVAQKTWGGQTEVVLMDADGSNEIIISPGDSGTGDIAQYSNPFWSDDGTVIGFVEVHVSNPNKVIAYDVAAGTRSYIYEPTTSDVANPDFIGSSKTSIIFWAYGDVGGADLWTWDGTTLTNITDTDNYKEYEPISNADGTKIVYWSGETTTEPIRTTHTLTYTGGVWVKDQDFTPIPDTYWGYWTTPDATHIALTVDSTKDILLYDSDGNFVADLSGAGYDAGTIGGVNQWNFFGNMPQGGAGEFVITSNAERGATAGRDIIIANPRTLFYVDPAGSDDNPGTQAAPFATIQKAVDEAADGTMIHVAAGTFVEQVITEKNVTISGAGPTTTIESPATLDVCWDTPNYDYFGVVCILDTNNVTLENLKIDGKGHGNGDYRFVGVGLHNGGGTLDTLEITGIRDTPFSGAQHGVAINAYNTDGVNRTISVQNCTIDDFQKNAMALNANETTPLTVEVHNNTITGAGPTGVTAQNGIQVWAAEADGSITNNTISGIGYTGSGWVGSSILIYQNYYGSLLIDNNTVTGAQTAIYNFDSTSTISNNTLEAEMMGDYCYGILASDPPSPAPAPYGEEQDLTGPPANNRAAIAVDILNNTITQTGADATNTFGIEAIAGWTRYDLALNITGNIITNFDYSIDIYQSTSNTGTIINATVRQNCITNSGSYGLWTNADYTTIDAELNFWGSVFGPFHPVDNPTGRGGAVTDYVDFSPWLDACGGDPTMDVWVLPVIFKH
jgi:hypothetical protein